MASCNYSMISLNVKGLNNYNKRKAIFKWLDNAKYDIILLQETHTTVDVESNWCRNWQGPIFFFHMELVKVRVVVY